VPEEQNNTEAVGNGPAGERRSARGRRYPDDDGRAKNSSKCSGVWVKAQLHGYPFSIAEFSGSPCFLIFLKSVCVISQALRK
jgi:hypothetical protein